VLRRIPVVVLAAALIALAQQNEPRKLRAWFPNGIGVEFDTETTGSTPAPSFQGALTITHDQFTRKIFDKDGNTLFAYVIEASAGPDMGTVTIRIKPLEGRLEELPLYRHGRGKTTPVSRQSEPIPTIAASREFRGLKQGQAVTLEILYNPATGARVYDILRPSTEVTPVPNGGMAADSAPVGEELSFREIALVINGEKIAAPAGWLTGAVARLYLPGHGAYFLSTYQPKTSQVFRHSVYVDRRNLEFAADRDFIRITSTGNVLTRSESAVVWVYHDPKYQLQSQSGAPDLVFADKVESLLR
jgi:hypothetical protein